MKKVYILLSIPILFSLSGCVIPMHLFLTNLTDSEVVVNYQVEVKWYNKRGHTRPFYNSPKIISNKIKSRYNNLYYADVDEINDDLDDSLENIKLKNFVYTKADTILTISLSLKPKQTIYFGQTTHFANLYGIFIESNMQITRNDTLLFDTKTLAELFDRERRFEVSRSMLVFSSHAKNLILWERERK